MVAGRVGACRTRAFLAPGAGLAKFARLAGLCVAGGGGAGHSCCMRIMISSLVRLAGAAALAFSLSQPALAQGLREGLARAAAGDWAGAAAAVQGAGPVARDIVEWQRLRAGQGLLGDYESFLARRPDWPGLPYLRRQGEEAVARSTTPARVIAYFGAAAPATGAGAVALVRALQQSGQADRAAQVAAEAWRRLPLSADEEQALQDLAPQAVARAHVARADHLLWEGRLTEAQRMLPRLPPGWQALARARIALRSEAEGVDALIAAVPADLAAHPGLAHDRMQWRARKGRGAEAAALMLERSASAEALGRPEAWADRRALLARQLLRDGQARTAYRLAAQHRLDPGADFADLEFLAGFIALRRLDDPQTALAHFRRLGAAVRTPISLSRAAYWEGRALEAAGDAAGARAAYGRAARHQTAYYGLLASERAGIALSPAVLEGPRFPDWAGRPAAQSSVWQAAVLLRQAGAQELFERFALHLAEGLSDTDLGALADRALTLGEPHLAVLLAKQAAERGLILPRAYYPVPDLVPDGLPVSRAFALAIARRESEFDPMVVSPAGARGLMQVMPATARLMAGELGLPYSAARLTSDPAYNVRLGAGYLAKLVAEFGPAVALVAAGYNAGPGRPRAWIQQFGDPRRPEVDVVDWVETIPFAETRTYVMRVSESVVLYRARLRGQAGPVRLTAELKG